MDTGTRTQQSGNLEHEAGSVTLRCTRKALALLKLGADTLADPPPSNDDWYMNLLWLDRRKCLLLTTSKA